MQPYHKYVFDSTARKFVGRFEEMYQREAHEGFDSWYQEDARTLQKQISLALFSRYNFGRILDFGCGKGTFSHLLKKQNNYVLGLDISATAIAKAHLRYPDIEFREGADLASVNETFDLVVAMELLSYLEHWRETLATIAGMTTYLYVSLYLPDKPIGFVKSFQELRTEVQRHFVVEAELVQDTQQLYILAKSQEATEAD